MADEPLTLRQWTDVVRRCRLGRTVKAVALVLATYADADGTRVFPGVALVAIDAEVTYNTAKAAMAKLRDTGLIERVEYGARRLGKADRYRLVLAPDLLDRVEVLTPAQVRVQADRMQTQHAGRRGGSRPGPDQMALDLQPTPPATNPEPDAVLQPTEQAPNPVDDAVDNPVLQPAPPATEQPDADGFGANGATPNPGFGANGACVLGPTPWATTIQDHATTTTSHPDEDLRTAVTPSRANGRQDPDSSSLPTRCDHGLRARRRGDGTSTCALCRIAETGRAFTARPATA